MEYCPNRFYQPDLFSVESNLILRKIMELLVSTTGLEVEGFPAIDTRFFP